MARNWSERTRRPRFALGGLGTPVRSGIGPYQPLAEMRDDTNNSLLSWRLLWGQMSNALPDRLITPRDRSWISQLATFDISPISEL
jgi:hypothetical protein